MLEWQGNILADVANRPTHPFQTINAFAASPIVNYSDKLNVAFSLPSNLFHYNMGSTYALEIDFDDSRGFRSYSVGQSNIPILYPDAGLKKIKFRVRLANNTILNCHALFEIILPDPSRSFQGTPDITLADITLSSSANGATIRGFSNCGDGRIRKPLIWVEGFNPTTTIPGFDLDFSWMRSKFERSEFVNNRRLWRHLEDEGYDLIYVDFFDGAGDLRENSKVVQAVIRAVNAQKEGNEQIVILGESMGGVLSKHALRTMERAGEAHNCRLFFAFDSPLHGANVPIGLQAMATHIASLSVRGTLLKDFIPQLKELDENILHSPAARQMLMAHIDDPFSHTSFYSELNGLGQLVNCRQVCISNGSENGNTADARQTIDMTMPLLKVNFNGARELAKFLGPQIQLPSFISSFQSVFDFLFPFIVAKAGKLSGTKANLAITVNPIPEGNTSFATVYDGEFEVKILFNKIIPFSSNKVTVRGFQPLDNAPGGINGASLAELPSAAITTLNNLGGFIHKPFTFCFVPTVSAMDLRTPERNNVFTNVSNYNQLVSSATTRAKAVVASNLASFSTFGFNQENQFHISFTNRNGIFFLQELTNEPNRVVNIGNLFSTYNFGATDAIPSNSYPFTSTTRVINRSQNLNSVNINIWVNRNGRIEYPSNSIYPACRTNNTFHVFVRKNKCSGIKTVITTATGGSLLLGEQTVNNSGNVTLEEESEIRVQNSGALRMENNSTLTVRNGTLLSIEGGNVNLSNESQIVIQNGGILNLTDGTLSLHDASQITVQNGGILNITEGTLNLHDASRVIVQNGGKVIITGGLSSLLATSQFIVEQGGIVEVKTDARVAFAANARFEVRGRATFDNNAITTFSDRSRLETTGEVRFNAGQLTLQNEALLQANDQSLLVFNSEMNIQMNHFAAIDVVQRATLRFDGSPFAAVRFRGGNDIAENTPIRLHGCQWIINAPMVVSGSAFFQVINDPSITYLNNLGFNLRGDGKRLNTPFRVLELMGVDFDIVNANIRHGKIIYQDHSSLGYSGGSLFTDVSFQGGNPDGQGVTAIINNNDIAGALNISNCLFDNVDHCVKIEAHPTLLSGDINIVSTTATRFKSLGFDFLLNGNINIMHSHFIASEAASDLATSGGSHFAPALRVRDIGSLRSTVVSNTVIESTVDWQHYPQWVTTSFDPTHDYSNSDPIYPPQNNLMQTTEDSYLIGLFNVVNFQLNNASEVRGGYIGILTDMGEADGSPLQNNVSISCSSVHDNYAGIVMVNIKDPTFWGGIVFGGLYLDAATIDNNVFGIYGRNIFVDANLTATRLPNTFGILNGTGNGHYMCIHYSNTTAPNGPLSNGVLLAPNNFWSSGAPVMNVNYLLDGNSINAAPAAAMSSDCVPNERHSTDPTATMASATDEQKAFITVNGVTKALLPLYWKGISEYLNNDVADAITTLSEITAIPLHLIQASDNPYLRSYHTLAWAIAPGPAVSDIGNQKIANIKNTNPMFVFPNPAEEYFKLVLPSGRYDVQLSDVLGRVIKQVQVADYEEISTENIQSGLYQITVRKQGEQAIFQTGKIVIKE